MKVNSATFYQAVRLGDGNQHNTVYPVSKDSMDDKYKDVHMSFKNGMVVVTGQKCQRWLEKNRTKGYLVGITNVRSLEVNLSELKGTPFEDCVPDGIVYPTRKVMMNFLREKKVGFAGNIKAIKLEELYDLTRGEK